MRSSRAITGVEATAYTVPTDPPEADGTLAWESTTLIVVHVSAGDQRGTGWSYGPAACASLVRDLLATARGTACSFAPTRRPRIG